MHKMKISLDFLSIFPNCLFSQLSFLFLQRYFRFTLTVRDITCGRRRWGRRHSEDWMESERNWDTHDCIFDWRTWVGRPLIPSKNPNHAGPQPPPDSVIKTDVTRWCGCSWWWRWRWWWRAAEERKFPQNCWRVPNDCRKKMKRWQIRKWFAHQTGGCNQSERLPTSSYSCCSSSVSPLINHTLCRHFSKRFILI